jgi:hypothetical protein
MLLQRIWRVSGRLRADKLNGKKWGKAGESLPEFAQAISAARVRRGDERLRAFLEDLQHNSDNALRGRFRCGIAAMLLFRGRDDPWRVGRK